MVAMNRDEFYDRPFSTLTQNNDLYYPIDTKSNGTWFAFNKSAKFALVTNIRRLKQNTPKKSRGEIPINVLMNNQDINTLDYKLFNLIAGNADSAYHISSFNQNKTIINNSSLTISNGQVFPSAWDKELRLKNQLDHLVQEEFSTQAIFNAMTNEDENLKQTTDNTGYSDEVEKRLSAFFIRIPEMNYGTVYQSIFLVDSENKIKYYERNLKDGNLTEIKEYTF